MHRWIIGYMAALVVMVSFGTEAAACSCTSTASPKERFDSSDAVFLGTVEKVDSFSETVTTEDFPKGFRSWYNIATIRVRQAWKGVKQPIVKIYTISAATCGYDFEANQDYLVYARQITKEGLSWPVGVLTTSWCGGTLSTSNVDFKVNFDFLRAFELGTPMSARHEAVGSRDKD